MGCRGQATPHVFLYRGDHSPHFSVAWGHLPPTIMDPDTMTTGVFNYCEFQSFCTLMFLSLLLDYLSTFTKMTNLLKDTLLTYLQLGGQKCGRFHRHVCKKQHFTWSKMILGLYHKQCLTSSTYFLSKIHFLILKLIVFIEENLKI